MSRLLPFLLGLLILAAGAKEAPRRPNFVIILADDMGYGDAGCYGGTALKTPHLDRLAAGGMRFTDFHSSGNVCSPTRAGLLTGRYQYRSGVDAVVNADPAVPAHHSGLQPEEFTFAEALKAKGYRVGLMGKWHVGYDRKYNPTHQGFDVFRGFVSGNIDYQSHFDRMGEFDWWHDLEKVREEGYSTHLITKHALGFIEAHKHEPFCLYVAHEAVHAPWQGPDDPAVRGPGATKGRGRSPKDALPAMMSAMDEGVGRIVAKLEELDLDERTLVFFFSDNGPAGGSAGPLRGRKGSNWEGGHRVPGIAWWPGTIKAGVVTDQLAISLDLMPTMLELAGASADPARPLDGVSLVPLLRRGEPLGNRRLFWNHKAMRDGRWKLILHGKGGGDPVGLYDLSKDIGERDNLAEEFPERVEKMKKALKAWSGDVTSKVTVQPGVEAFQKGKW
ncbi:sulfatase [Haloferula sp. A504]|uniref:sulfatase n=1 Tax=Haloferula sp. A504 TaxID=3373601 RepID=UPI0031BD8FBB|nr:sulfatase [Verrucomicrobiaceae bacterium E54]